MIEDEDLECEETCHVFEVEEDEATPDDRRCGCGSHTWGEMNELYALTTMMEGREPAPWE